MAGVLDDVTVSGASLADSLLRAQLARPYDRRHRQGWCGAGEWVAIDGSGALCNPGAHDSAYTLARTVKRRRHRRRGLLRILGLLPLLWLAGFLLFLTYIRTQGDFTMPADAIVVLTGGGERLREGIVLLMQHRAERLFITGVQPGLGIGQIMATLPPEARPSPERAMCCIELGYEADSTVGNADETALWIAEKGYRSLILVTAFYHMPRSLIEFRRFLPWVDIYPHPVVTQDMRMSHWYTRPHILAILATEYNKFLAAFVRNRMLAILS
ncbi:MAG TPA: YdcF family protein [Dongiaceae bacterium]|jgi:uncharacterized SAM-binding protein YcdF (DUF218 family)|nr:YdcF family protein [Dongiaceae bacterium]